MSFNDPNIIIFGQLVLALLLGMFLGLERNIARRSAGMRTYALVSMGCCLLIVVSNLVISQNVFLNFDPLRLAAGIVTGVGFIGAGMIINRDEKNVSGITTSAGLWVSAAIGMTVGFGFYSVAIFATFLGLFTFTVLWYFEQFIEKRWEKVDNKETV